MERRRRIRTGCRQCTGGPTPLWVPDRVGPPRDGADIHLRAAGTGRDRSHRANLFRRPHRPDRVLPLGGSGASRIGCTGSRCSASRYRTRAIRPSTSTSGGLSPTGYVGYQSQPQLALAAEPQCVLAVPDGLTAPARGAVIEVPVVPAPNCRPWLAPGAMNPGPHAGPVTIREQVEASGMAQALQERRPIGGTEVTITQAADRPAAPILRGAVEGERIHLRWDPAPGAGITAFENPRGGARRFAGQRRGRGQQPGATGYPLRLGPVLMLSDFRRKLSGAGPVLERGSVRLGAATPPDVPVGLVATVVDDQVTLAWQPATTAPAPSGYVVEAAAAGASGFVAVARTADERLFPFRVPPGTWQARVRAVSAGGASAPTAPVTISPSPCTAPPGPPRSPWPLRTYPSFSFAWSPPSTGPWSSTSSKRDRIEGASDFGRVRVGGDRIAITLPQINSNATGFARIRARNACGESPASGDVMIQRP